MKIYAFIQMYNEESTGNLKRCLNNCSKWADKIIIYDDKSTDNSVELAKQYTENIILGGKNEWLKETFHKEEMLQYIHNMEEKPDWILWIDCDEIVDRNCIYNMKKFCEVKNVDAFSFQQINLWRGERYYRTDGPLYGTDFKGAGWFVRLWKYIPNLTMKQTVGMDQRLYPINIKNIEPCKFKIIHYGFSNYKKTMKHIGVHGSDKQSLIEIADGTRYVKLANEGVEWANNYIVDGKGVPNMFLNESVLTVEEIPNEWFPEENIPKIKYRKPLGSPICNLIPYKEIKVYVIVTGLSGAGKTTYCNNSSLPFLCYDDVFNYTNSSLLFDKIDTFLEKYKTSEIIYLDAYNTEFISYIKNKTPHSIFKCKFLYTSLDNHYETLAIKDPRNFITATNFSYDSYISNIKNSSINLYEISSKLFAESFISEFSCIYRTEENKYIEYPDNTHLLKILNKTKKEITLEYIDNKSGHSSYQSIILDGEYIKRGTEKDWLSFDNILKCTSLKNKVVCDTGCFNGYFSFRSLEEGAKQVIGIDHNEPAIDICKKICIWNNYHMWKLGEILDASEIDFHLKKIGKDEIFNFDANIDILFALNYLHHLKNELGLDAFLNTLDSFFKNSKEIIFEINEPEIEYIENIAENNNFILSHKIESHRKTSFGNRWILHYTKK